MARVAIVGGGPAGYEAALVAAQLGAEVTLVDRDGLGGSCVLTDCVPSKTLIASSDVRHSLEEASELGVHIVGGAVDAGLVLARVKALALAQSTDIAAALAAAGVRVVTGQARLLGAGGLAVDGGPDGPQRLESETILLAVGARPRVLPAAQPDGERILTWRQLYDLSELPEHLVVVGSGVTGAEFAGAFRALGCEVTLVSSRDRVLPGEDEDAAEVIESVFTRRGIRLVERARASAVRRAGHGVEVLLDGGGRVTGSHALMAVGSVPRTEGLGLAEAGVVLEAGGRVRVDRVSRTTAPGVYAAGDCTGVLMLASVAAMQGRIAMWHALGQAVAPLRLDTVSATVFTSPEIATVGVSQLAESANSPAAVRSVRLPLATNARAKMHGITDGFVKIFARTGPGTVLGGVVVAPRASELVLPLSLAVQHGLTVDQLAHTFAIYPSLSGSMTEAARLLMNR